MEPTKMQENEKALIRTILASNANLSSEAITELVEKDVYVFHYHSDIVGIICLDDENVRFVYIHEAFQNDIEEGIFDPIKDTHTKLYCFVPFNDQAFLNCMNTNGFTMLAKHCDLSSGTPGYLYAWGDYDASYIVRDVYNHGGGISV